MRKIASITSSNQQQEGDNNFREVGRLALLQSYLSQPPYRSSLYQPTPRQLNSALNQWFKEAKKSLLTEFEKNCSRTKLIPYRNPVELFFYYWNMRDMNSAILLCDEECEFEDTLFPTVYKGRDEILTHLNNVANAVPDNFKFIIDDLAEDPRSGNVGIQWHVEANDQLVPFTRGASMYKVNGKGLITKGFDVPEPLLKIGSINLSLLKIVNKVLLDPWRLLPLATWIFYIWFLFFSEIPPGNNVFHISSDTIQEVINLSINFWLFLPLFFDQISPVIHPMLEGLFNLIIVWSLLFAGFIVDGKRKDSNGVVNTFGSTLIGMQFLTNAFYLPYLVQRVESPALATIPRLTSIEKFFESKLFCFITGFMALLFVYWGVFGRCDLYGELPDRLVSFQTLVSQDRLAFSFIFDALCYALFQGWLIRDDLNRRLPSLVASFPLYARIGQIVPFFGLLIYFFFRPSLRKSKDEE